MRKTIMLGSNEVEMVANAASPLLFREVFKKDFLTAYHEMNKEETGEALELMQMMAFIMKCQAGMPREKLHSITRDMYDTWVEDELGPMDIAYAFESIIELYFGQTIATAIPKAKGA